MRQCCALPSYAGVLYDGIVVIKRWHRNERHAQIARRCFIVDACNYSDRSVLSLEPKVLFWVLLGLEQAECAGARHRFGTAFGLQFGEDAQIVTLDRAERDDQCLGNLLIGKPLSNEAQHFEFAFAE